MRWLIPMLTLSLACSPPGGCEAGRAPTLQIGVGERDFQDPTLDGGRTVLIHGPQGGYHSFVSLRATHLDVLSPWDLTLTGQLDGEVIASAALSRDARCQVWGGGPLDQAGEVVGTWLVWQSTPDVLDGQDVTVQAEVVVDGVTVQAEAVQTIWDETR